MVYKIDEIKYQEARKKKILFGYIRLGMGISFFGYLLFVYFPFEIILKFLFFTLLVFMGVFLDRILLRQAEKEIRTLEIELTKKYIVKYQLGKKQCQLDLNQIQSVKRFDSGILIKSIDNRKLFIPALMEEYEEIEKQFI